MEREVVFYVLRSPIDGEVRYVGKTVEGINKRLNRHINNGKGHVGNWVRALIKEGLKPIIEHIGKCSEKDNWQEIEKILISEYREYGYNLCNLCDGGFGASGFKRDEEQCIAISERNSTAIFAYSTEAKNVTAYKSFKEASEKLGISQPSISKAIKNKGQRKGYLFSYTNLFEQSNVSVKYRRAVICKTRNGEELKFRSSNEAGKQLKLDPAFIRKVCNGKYKKYKDYEFRYAE